MNYSTSDIFEKINKQENTLAERKLAKLMFKKIWSIPNLTE